MEFLNLKINKEVGFDWIVEALFYHDCKDQELLIKNFLKEEHKKRR